MVYPGRWLEEALAAIPLLLLYELVLSAPLAAWCGSGRFRRAARTTPVRLYLLVLDAGLFLAIGIPLALAAGLFCLAGGRGGRCHHPRGLSNRPAAEFLFAVRRAWPAVPTGGGHVFRMYSTGIPNRRSRLAVFRA